MKSRRLTVVLAALVVVFVGVLVLGQVVLRPSNEVGSPSQSNLRVVEELFPPRVVTARQVRRGGPTCLQGNTLVAPAGGGCSFIVPNGIHVVTFRRVPTSAPMMVTLSQTGDLTQTVDTGQPGPDPRNPLQLRFASVRNGATVTLFGCQGPGTCRLQVGG